jgi:hypothetical protein
MVDMDVNKYLVHGALLSHLGEQITLPAPDFNRNPLLFTNRIVGMTGLSQS